MSETPAAPVVLQIPDTERISVDQLLAKVKDFADRKFRLVTVTCIDSGDNYEVYYHFDKETHMEHLLLTVPRETPVPSITPIYLAAFLVENEMKELFGLQVTDIAIDYHGHLFLTEESEPTPMAKR